MPDILGKEESNLDLENLRTFFDTLDELIFITTTEGIILHTNNTVEKLLGYSEKELLKKNILYIYILKTQKLKQKKYTQTLQMKTLTIFNYL